MNKASYFNSTLLFNCNLLKRIAIEESRKTEDIWQIKKVLFCQLAILEKEANCGIFSVNDAGSMINKMTKFSWEVFNHYSLQHQYKLFLAKDKK